VVHLLHDRADGARIPLEIFEIFRRPWGFRRYLLLAVNAAILLYLWKRRNEFRDRSGKEENVGLERLLRGVPPREPGLTSSG